MTTDDTGGRLGVGIIGAGPVVQAIHLPTLARLSDRFDVRAVVDIDATVAESVAERVSARAGTDYQELLDDPTIDVIAVCTPAALHADQVIRAMEAGKRAVFCEKPLARTLEDAQLIAQTARRTAVPLVVGAMHAFDPGWLAVNDTVDALARTAHTIRSSIVLPMNQRFEDLATDILARPAPELPRADDTNGRARLISAAVLELAIHDLPLIRRFLQDSTQPVVTSATALEPFGYAINAVADGRIIELFGQINALWQPRWEFEAVSDDIALHIEFTPSYVQAGSATATVSRNGIVTNYGGYDHNGYEGEWRTVHDLATGSSDPAPRLDGLLDDLTFAVRLAEAASNSVLVDALA